MITKKIKKEGFARDERLRSQKIISDLFVSGKTVKHYPFKLIYTLQKYEDVQCRIVISVPKKLFKRAVKRNYIRRRIREVYRKNKNILYNQENYTLNLIVIYVSTEIIEYATVERKFIEALQKTAKHVKENNDISVFNAD